MHYFLVLKENEPTRDCLRKHDYSDETWVWHCLMQILSFQTSELRIPKREVQIIWLDFPQGNPTYLQHWLVEYSHNWASTGSLTLFSLPLLRLKLWCFGSLLSDLTLMNIQHTQPQMQLPSENTRRRCWRSLTSRHINLSNLQLPRHTLQEAYSSSSTASHLLQKYFIPSQVHCCIRCKSWRNCHSTEDIPHTLTF